LTERGRRHRRPRGVVLLIVISLLALFILLGATFTLVALQALNASKLDAKVSQYGDPAPTEMDLILGQILYDTQARTVLQYHSFLRDLYGDDRVQGQITLTPPLTGTPGTGKQFYTLQISSTGSLSPI